MEDPYEQQHNVERDDWIVAGLALLLLIDVLLLPWWHRMPAASHATVSESRPAVQAPYAWAGIVAAVSLVALLVDLGMQRLKPGRKLPAIGGSRRATRLVLAVIAVAFLVIKFLLHPSNLGWGFFFAVVVSIALLYAAVQASRGASPIPGR